MKGRHVKPTERSEFKIEKNIPLPVTRAATKYPFADMQVGDSFLVRTKDEAHARGVSQSLYTALKRFRTVKPTWRFTCRSQLPEGVRCWRIPDAEGHNE
jgi:hypothetical protein